MGTDNEVDKYTVDFELTVEVEARDSVEAIEEAMRQRSFEDALIYVDGNLFGTVGEVL